MRRKLGVAMIGAPFIAIAFWATMAVGFGQTAAVFCGIALLMVWMWAAVSLLEP